MLETIQSHTYNLVTSVRFWMILLVIIIFLIVAGYLYNKYVTPMVDQKFIPNNEYSKETTDENEDSGSDGNKEVELYIFTVQWCPHSKNAIPIWSELKEEYGEGKTFNGYKINFVEIDGEENPDLADKYKVEGYPTIKLLKGNQVIEYDAKPTKEHLKEFLNSTLV